MQKRPRGRFRPSKHKEPQQSQELYVTVIGPIEKMVSVEAKSRSGLIMKKSAHSDKLIMLNELFGFPFTQ